MSDDNDAAPELTPAAAERHVDRGMALADRMDLDGALADFAAVEAALRFSHDPAARVQWARSLNGLGFIDLMDAKTARAAVSELDEETDQVVRWGLKQALARFEQSLLGRFGDAREAFRRLFAEGGRDAYDGQVRDTERYPIPEDRAIRRLIDEIWEENTE